MEELFLRFANYSLVASYVALAILVVRLLIRRAPKWLICLMWSLVAIRLIFPFSVESTFSLIPSAEPLPKNIIYSARPTVNSGIPVIDNSINPILSETFEPELVTSINPTQIISYIASRIWIIGVSVMIVYALVSSFLLMRRLSTATLLQKGVKQSERVESPFVFGIIRPVIYLPYEMSEDDLNYVMAHERAHISRMDHLWKPLGFLLLSVYWFNPILWIAYILLCRDIEAACDEKVIKDMELDERKAYSMALLHCSVHRRMMITACPIAFGENSVKSRIKKVMNYKKPAFWILIISIVVLIVGVVCFLTNPKSDADVFETDGTVMETDENLLTMQELVRLVTSKSWNKTQQEEGIVFWDRYNNLLEDETFHKASLTGLRRLQLEYDGTQFELQVYYWPEDSAKQEGYSVGELDMIRLRNVKTDDAILLFSSDIGYTVNTDIESFLLKKYDLPKELLTGNECGALNGEILYSDYNVDMFLNFAGCLFENSNYREPTHGDSIPSSWCSLGGVGVCNDPNYDSFEIFENGILVEYYYLGNHMSCDLLKVFSAGEYSGCLYRYNLDLVTTAEMDLLKDGEPAKSEYWVVFFTKGQGEPLYMKFFNCDYYSQKDALESIANGTDILFGASTVHAGL